MAKKIYLNFPITMVPDIYTDTLYNAFDRIINYGILSYMKSKNLEFSNAIDKMGITWKDGSVEKIRKSINSVIDSPVITGIEKERAFKYRDSKRSYTENRESRDDIMLLCGELAIRSIIGVKRYSKCYRGLVLSRMAGIAKSISEYELPDAVRQYAGENGKRRWRKLIRSLQAAGYSIYCPTGCRGFYVSYRMTLEELATAVEKKRVNTKSVYQLSDEARRLALERLGRTP